MTTIYDLLLELSSFITVSEELKDKAFDSDINDENHGRFKKLLHFWNVGDYDESPELLLQSLKGLL